MSERHWRRKNGGLGFSAIYRFDFPQARRLLVS